MSSSTPTPHLSNSELDPLLRGAVGLVRTAPRRMVSVEPFFMEFIDGVESVLRAQNVSVLLAVTETIEEEIETYRRWAAGQMVGGVLVMNVMEEDPRLLVLQELGLAAVLVGLAKDPLGFPSVHADDAAGMREVVAHLRAQGHSRIAQITGPAQYSHTATRVRVFNELAAEHGLDITTVTGDYSEHSGEALTQVLIGSKRPPTAIIYHNDVMAVAGLHALRGAGVRVPQDVALVAWDDSALCRLTQPPLTTAALDVFGMGRRSGVVLADEWVGRGQSSPVVLTPVLTARGSTLGDS